MLMTPAMASESVLRRRAVSQHLDAFDGRERDGVHISAGRSSANGGIDVQQCAVVAPFTVDQYQRLVRAQASQGGRA